MMGLLGEFGLREDRYRKQKKGGSCEEPPSYLMEVSHYLMFYQLNRPAKRILRSPKELVICMKLESFTVLSGALK